MGIATWSTAQWLAEATRCIDEHVTRTGAVEQPHLRPWSTVLRAPTSAGPVWMKAAGPGTAFEAGLYELLPAIAPWPVLTPIAVDTRRAWILLPDGGPPANEVAGAMGRRRPARGARRDGRARGASGENRPHPRLAAGDRHGAGRRHAMGGRTVPGGWPRCWID